MKNLSELAPLVRISLFILGGWLAGKGVDPTITSYIQTDPEVLSTVLLATTGAWYAAAKLLNWKR